MPAVLEVDGLSKRYGSVQALDEVSLGVQRGEVFGFLGPNGAGKTTFTKCVTGFVRPNKGQVRVLGIDTIHQPHKAAPHIGLVPDQYDFYSNLTGRQHLDFYGRLMGMGGEPRKARIEEVLELVRMTDRADRRVKGYSHGMKQRICIAQAILHDPKIIFFDEPTNGLDPKGAYELREMIKGLGTGGTTVFLNSHVLHEVEQVCERVAILDRGVMKTVAKVSDLRSQFGESGQASIEVLNPTKKQFEALRQVVESVRKAGNTFEFAAAESQVPQAVSAVVGAGGQVVGVDRQRLNLESIFLRLTEEQEAPA